MQLIDGKAISEQVKQEIAAEVAEIVAKGGKRPHLAAILVGHDGGSETYVAAKVKACEVCGFKSTLIRYEAVAVSAGCSGFGWACFYAPYLFLVCRSAGD